MNPHKQSTGPPCGQGGSNYSYRKGGCTTSKRPLSNIVAEIVLWGLLAWFVICAAITGISLLL